MHAEEWECDADGDRDEDGDQVFSGEEQVFKGKDQVVVTVARYLIVTVVGNNRTSTENLKTTQKSTKISP